MIREGLLSYPDLNDFLVKGYAKQIKERNQATGEFTSLNGPPVASFDSRR